MAWIVGADDIYLGERYIEGLWEVDADSEQAAIDAAEEDSLIPYLIVGVVSHDSPYREVSWLTAGELRRTMGDLDMATGELDETGMPMYISLTEDEVMELAGIMDTLSDGVMLSEFIA